MLCPDLKKNTNKCQMFLSHPRAQATKEDFFNVLFDPYAVLLGVLSHAYINITLRLVIS